MNLQAYWAAVLRQDAAAMRPFFAPDAHIDWVCTAERFTVEEFIRANCEYPGAWRGEIERVEQCGSVTVTAVHVCTQDGAQSFHVVSFMELHGGLIAALTEYWGDDAPAPAWRLNMRLGVPLRHA